LPFKVPGFEPSYAYQMRKPVSLSSL